MAGKALTRKGKAATLLPLALISAAWTASLATVGTTAVAGQASDRDLPDGSAVPSQAIEAPASVPVRGAIAPTVPNGTADQVVAAASTNGIPSAALSAYQRGSQIMGAADATCHIPWELVAAIGRVESNHGQFGGNTLTEDGVSTPGIYGPVLNGKNGTAAIYDTDGGELDKDAVYDRAVGPMQFIPSTWSTVKVDADGDGKRNPQDIDDAALASAVYLCSGNEDLATRAGQETAVYRYNHSRAYVNLVLRIMEAYSVGDYTAIPSGTYGGTLFSPTYTSQVDNQAQANQSNNNGPSTSPNNNTTTPPPTTDGGGSGGSGGDDGGDDGTSPLPDTDNDGGSGPLGDVTDTVTKTVDDVLKPVVDVLTASEALSLCSAQLGAIPDPLGLLNGLTDNCASRVEGKEEDLGAALIPSTLTGVLDWLT